MHSHAKDLERLHKSAYRCHRVFRNTAKCIEQVATACPSFVCSQNPEWQAEHKRYGDHGGSLDGEHPCYSGTCQKGRCLSLTTTH